MFEIIEDWHPATQVFCFLASLIIVGFILAWLAAELRIIFRGYAPFDMSIDPIECNHADNLTGV